MNTLSLAFCVAIGLSSAAFGDVLPNGDFEKPIDATAGNWQPGPSPNFQIVQDGSNHYATFTSLDKNYRTVASATVPVDPTWKQIDISAKLKVKHLVAGAEGWQTARVTTVFLDENQKILLYSGAINLWSDTSWVSRVVRDDVPAGAKFLRVDAGNFGVAGELSVDDIKVNATPSFSAPLFASGAFDGSFEKTDADGNPVGWSIGGSGFEVASEAGNHFLRVTNAVIGHRPETKTAFAIPAGWKSVSLSARVRGKDLQGPAGATGTATLALAFLNADGNLIYPLPATAIDVTAGGDWATKSGKWDVPGNAKFVQLQASMRNCSGRFDIDDVTLGGN